MDTGTLHPLCTCVKLPLVASLLYLMFLYRLSNRRLQSTGARRQFIHELVLFLFGMVTISRTANIILNDAKHINSTTKFVEILLEETSWDKLRPYIYIFYGRFGYVRSSSIWFWPYCSNYYRLFVSLDRFYRSKEQIALDVVYLNGVVIISWACLSTGTSIICLLMLLFSWVPRIYWDFCTDLIFLI